MQRHDHELAKRLFRPANGGTVKPSPETAEARRWRIMVAMWERMGQWFGPQWEQRFGTVKDQTIHAWQGALNEFSEQELAGAIKACADWDGKFPPTFPEFKALCHSARAAQRPNVTERRLAREKAEPKSVLEHLEPHAISETAQRELARMIQLSEGEEVETREESMRKLELHRRWGA